MLVFFVHIFEIRLILDYRPLTLTEDNSAEIERI